MVYFPTHKKGNILDLVLTNNPNIDLTVEDAGLIGKSDHNMILAKPYQWRKKFRTGQKQTKDFWNTSRF